jgi:hypothetical protein
MLAWRSSLGILCASFKLRGSVPSQQNSLQSEVTGATLSFPDDDKTEVFSCQTTTAAIPAKPNHCLLLGEGCLSITSPVYRCGLPEVRARALSYFIL